MRFIIVLSFLFGSVASSIGAVTVDAVNLHADSFIPYNWVIFDGDFTNEYLTEFRSIDITNPVTTSKYMYNNGHSNNGQLEGVPNIGRVDPSLIGLDGVAIPVYGLVDGRYAFHTGNSWAEAGLSLDLSNGISVNAFQNVRNDAGVATTNLSISVRFTVTGDGAVLNFHETWYWYGGNAFIITDPTTGQVVLNSADYSVGSFYHNDDIEDRLFYLDNYVLAPGTYEFSNTFHPDSSYVPSQFANLSIVPVPEMGSALLTGAGCSIYVVSRIVRGRKRDIIKAA